MVISACTRSWHQRLGEFAVTAQKDSGEGFFERANHMLSWIGMVIMRISKLILEIFGGDGRTRGVRNFVVEFVKDWIDSSSL